MIKSNTELQAEGIAELLQAEKDFTPAPESDADFLSRMAAAVADWKPRMSVGIEVRDFRRLIALVRP